MKTTRRGFFGILAGAAVVAATRPLPAIAYETIYADGIHCDAAGVEALFRGDVVNFADPEIAKRITACKGNVNFGGASLTLRRGVHLQSPMSLANVHLYPIGLLPHEGVITIHGFGDLIMSTGKYAPLITMKPKA